MGDEPHRAAAVTSRWRRENSARLADLFALLADAPVGIALVAGFDGRLLQANPALCRLLGYSEPALRRLTLAELGEAENVVELARRGSDGALVESERRYRRRDGGHASVSVS
ncbi:MAG TPA: PAS domain S-box protein, partial [Solirubrobacteraceae bacterium]|nr:PAS domain S-box protein [Solirubrobacteraceae bacterium]